MPRRWSRAVVVLCVLYLLVLFLFHHQLDPFRDDSGYAYDYQDARELNSVHHLSGGSNSSSGSSHALTYVAVPHPPVGGRAWNLKRQLRHLEAGMTKLEKEISNVKATLIREATARIRDHQLESERLRRRQIKEDQRRQQLQRQRFPDDQALSPVDHQEHQVRLSHSNSRGNEDDRQNVQAGAANSLEMQQQQQVEVKQLPVNARQTLPAARVTGENVAEADGNDLDMHVLQGNVLNGAAMPVEDVDYSNSSLIKVAEGVAVYAAYHDDRLPLKPTVRLIVILSATKTNRRVLCHFHSPDLTSTVEAEQYELCENHKRKYLGFIYSCPVPGKVRREQYKLSLSPQHFPDRRVTVPVLDVTPPEIRTGKVPQEKSQYKYNYSVCVSPLFGSLLAKRLVEFMELTRLLGVQQVFFYDFQLSSAIRRVLDYYLEKGWATVVPWKLPEGMSRASRIWYHGQLVSNNDCLYRTMAVSAFTAFHDIDEFIVPHTPDARTWGDLFPSTLPNDTCGYSFPSAFYDPGISIGDFPDDLMTVALTARPAMLSKIRTKVLVDPRRVFEVGIHHISKQLLEHWAPHRYDPSVALLHHYRECIRDFGMRCENWFKDTTIRDRYMPELKVRVAEAVMALKL